MLDESQVASRSLSVLATDLKLASTSDRADQLASAAEQLSTAVQEMSGSAAQIMSAVDQISRGAQQQAAATQRSQRSDEPGRKDRAIVPRERRRIAGANASGWTRCSANAGRRSPACRRA